MAVFRAFDVKELFELEGRGLVVITNKTYRQLDSRLALKVGDPVEFRQGERNLLRSRIAGIEISTPWSPDREFAFLLPTQIRKDDVPLFAEIWIDDSHAQ
jgi:hypothetical protein